MKQLSNSIWVLEGPTNIGFIVKNNLVTLIDSGNDKEAGRRINKILKEKGWTLEKIINTHSNADHIGANAYLQRNLNCEIYATQTENMFIENPALETAFLWGGREIADLRNKFFQAKPSRVTRVIDNNEEIENGSKAISLKGHFFNMIGILSDEGVFFLGDSLFGKEILDKYKIPFIYNVEDYKKSISTIQAAGARYYVPSHGPVVTRIEEMATENLQKVDEIEEKIIAILKTEKTNEQIIKEICDSYQIKLNTGQYALIGSTIRSFLSYLADEKKIRYEMKANLLKWETI